MRLFSRSAEKVKPRLGIAIVEFVVGGVLPEIRILRMLEGVEFIEELKVPLPPLGDRGVIRVAFGLLIGNTCFRGRGGFCAGLRLAGCGF